MILSRSKITRFFNDYLTVNRIWGDFLRGISKLDLNLLLMQRDGQHY